MVRWDNVLEEERKGLWGGGGAGVGDLSSEWAAGLGGRLPGFQKFSFASSIRWRKRASSFRPDFRVRAPLWTTRFQEMWSGNVHDFGVGKTVASFFALGPWMSDSLFTSPPSYHRAGARTWHFQCEHLKGLSPSFRKRTSPKDIACMGFRSLCSPDPISFRFSLPSFTEPSTWDCEFDLLPLQLGTEIKRKMVFLRKTLTVLLWSHLPLRSYVWVLNVLE